MVEQANCQVTVRQENNNGREYGYGVYVNAYVTDKWGNETRYASECVPFGRNTPENIACAERRVKANARAAFKKEFVG